MTTAHQNDPPLPDSPRDFLFAGLVLGAVFLALTAMTWRRWPDLVIDFGVQLYLPWKLSTGAVLYRDLPYLTGGPLSQYFDALLFRIFGASVLTLVLANLALLVALLVVVYRGFYRAAGQVTALMTCLAILLAFAFEHYSNYGIFNYVTPYSQEIYHGLVIAIVAVWLLSRWVSGQKTATALAAGFCCGLVFLTKAEVFAAVMAAVVAGFFLAWRAGQKVASLAQIAGLMLLAGAVPAIGFFLYFLRHGSFRQSAAWTCWAWTPLLTTPAADSPFYRWCLGLDAPGLYLRQMLVRFVALAAVATLSALVFRRCKDGRAAIAAWIALAAPFAVLSWNFKWEDSGRTLPLLCLAVLFLLWRRAQGPVWTPSAVFAGIWTVFSLALLAKLGLHCRIWHYGFALAMPAFLAGCYLFLHLLPDALEEYGVPPNLMRSLAGAILAVALVQLMLGSKYTYQKKTLPVAAGADLLWTFPAEDQPAGACLAFAFSWMQTNTLANSTLATLPQGAMLNFLLRRSNPSGYLRWTPPEMAAFGESNMTRALEQSPPDFIVLLGLDNGEFGAGYLGDKPGFGLDLMQWINRRYRPVCQIGDDWTKTGQFGLKILKREPPQP